MQNDLQQLEVKASNMKNFSEAVNSEVSVKVEDIMKSAEDEKDKLLEKANDEALQMAYDRIKKEIKVIQAKYFKIIAKAGLDSKKQILTHREELIADLFKSIENELIAFKNSASYEKYLTDCITSEKIQPGAVIFIAPSDEKYQGAIKACLPKGCTVETDNNIKLGGLSVMYREDNIIIDKTIDSKLKDERIQFNRKNCFSIN